MDRDAPGLGTGFDQADVADLLTLARLICAPIMLWLVSIRSLDAAVLVVVIAWWTDFLDGRLARKAHRETRLKDWDLRADACLASAMGLGLGLVGYFSWWLVAPLAAVVVVNSIRPSNLAVVMAGIGFQYAMFILAMRLWADLWWVSVLHVIIFLVAGWRRLWDVLFPAFWESSGVLVPRRRRHRGLVVEDRAE
ncbi:MAG: CDP-alcohol phosphatidyltransferase family protein [bacterium]|nr:CDP-alcohol phosphatidyltransferase family protein [bacterium]